MPKACDEPVGFRACCKSRIRQVAGEGHRRTDGTCRGGKTEIYSRRAEKCIKKERHWTMSGALSFGKNFAKSIVRQNAGKVKKIGIYSLFLLAISRY